MFSLCNLDKGSKVLKDSYVNISLTKWKFKDIVLLEMANAVSSQCAFENLVQSFSKRLHRKLQQWKSYQIHIQ